MLLQTAGAAAPECSTREDQPFQGNFLGCIFLEKTTLGAALDHWADEASPRPALTARVITAFVHNKERKQSEQIYNGENNCCCNICLILSAQASGQKHLTEASTPSSRMDRKWSHTGKQGTGALANTMTISTAFSYSPVHFMCHPNNTPVSAITYVQKGGTTLQIC